MEFRKDLADRELTGEIIAAAIAVQRELGPGYVESIYEEALCVEFGLRGILHERQKVVDVAYRAHKVGEHRLDLLVEHRVVVELKAVKALEDVHFAVVRSYMKALDTPSGLLLNFGTIPLTIKRVTRENANTRLNSTESEENESGKQEQGGKKTKE